MPGDIFGKRASKVIAALVQGANDATFTRVSAISAQAITEEEPANVSRVVDTLSRMGMLEVTKDENGASIRLSPSGVDLLNTMPKERV